MGSSLVLQHLEAIGGITFFSLLKNYFLPSATLPGATPIEFVVGGQRHTAPLKKFEQNF